MEMAMAMATRRATFTARKKSNYGGNDGDYSKKQLMKISEFVMIAICSKVKNVAFKKERVTMQMWILSL